jgi:alpha-ketoglutarate-dependent taurine dioxygenase
MRRPLAPEQVSEVVAAMDRYAVLVFRGQAMEQEEQVAMARQFGPLNPGLKQIGRQTERMRERELIDISNLDAEGGPMGADTKKMISQLANQLWHSDSSFQSPAVSYSMLNAVRLPAWGGETEFADLRAAWDTLPERLKAMVRGREAEHFALHSRITLLGDDGYTEEQLKALPPVVWPLVRVHPGRADGAVLRHPRAADPRHAAGRGADAAAGPAGARDPADTWSTTHEWRWGPGVVLGQRCNPVSRAAALRPGLAARAAADTCDD